MVASLGAEVVSGWFGYQSVLAADQGAPCQQPWLLAVAVSDRRRRPLVLMADMQHLNHGASLSNVCEHAVAETFHRLLRRHAGDPFDADWVELGSDGCFDCVLPTPAAVAGALCVRWQPVTGAGEARTLAAFRAAFGRAADMAWNHARTCVYAVHEHVFRARRRGDLMVQSLVPAATSGKAARLQR